MFTQQAFPKIRIFQRHVGLFYTVNGSPIQINRPGMADAWGWLPLKEEKLVKTDGRPSYIPSTLIIEIEFKTGNAKQSKEQKAWQAFCHSMGVLYILCRDKEDVSKQIRARLNVSLN